MESAPRTGLTRRARYHRAMTGNGGPRGTGYRAVFFDAGETLVHPHPSFPELLSA